MFRRVSTFLSLPTGDQLASLEAAFFFARARKQLRRPFSQLVPLLGEHCRETSRTILDRNQLECIFRVRQAVKVVSKRLPWDCKCFAQALVAKAMLERREVEGTLYLGVKRGGERGIEAHAWLRSGDQLVTGGKEFVNYAAVSSFAFGPQLMDRPWGEWTPKSHVSTPDALVAKLEKIELR
ncbi:MAG: lasso peptide biosynthesis B2 protein [Verrucomicrobiota bacterium]